MKTVEEEVYDSLHGCAKTYDLLSPRQRLRVDSFMNLNYGMHWYKQYDEILDTALFIEITDIEISNDVLGTKNVTRARETLVTLRNEGKIRVVAPGYDGQPTMYIVNYKQFLQDMFDLKRKRQNELLRKIEKVRGRYFLSTNYGKWE